MNQPSRLGIIFGLLLLTITVDQFTKNYAVNHLKYSPPQIYLQDTFRIQYAENTGAFLGWGSDWSPEIRFWVFTIAVGGLLALLIFYVIAERKMSAMQTVALALIAGGGVSNFVDRAMNDGRVVDFMNMGIDGLRTGIFNFADVFIMIGLGLIILELIGGMRHPEAGDANQPAASERDQQLP